MTHECVHLYTRPTPLVFPFLGDGTPSHSFVCERNQGIALDTLLPLPASLHTQQHLIYSVTQTSHESGCFSLSPQPSQATYHLTFRLSSHFLMIFHRGLIHSFAHLFYNCLQLLPCGRCCSCTGKQNKVLNLLNEFLQKSVVLPKGQILPRLFLLKNLSMASHCPQHKIQTF